MVFNRTRLTIIVVSSLLSACNEPKEDTTENAFVRDHLAAWEGGIEQVLEIAEAMPEEHYGYTPHDSLMTFAEQLVHIAIHTKEIAYWYLEDTRYIDEEGYKERGNKLEKQELIELVEESLEEVSSLFLSLSDESLQEPIESFIGNQMSRREGLIFVHDHLTNHKAKLNVYLRLKGIQPVVYRYL